MAMSNIYGFTLPFQRASGSLGYLEVSRDALDASKYNLKSLFLTNWGERPMHYRMGCNFIEFLFENRKDVELKNKIADRIFEQVGTWLPFLSIESLNVLFYSDDPSIPEQNIRIKTSFKITGVPGQTGILDLLI